MTAKNGSDPLAPRKHAFRGHRQKPTKPHKDEFAGWAGRAPHGLNVAMAELSVLVVGCGNMGSSHARAYHQLADFRVVGLVARGAASRDKLSQELGGVPTFADFETAYQS